MARHIIPTLASLLRPSHTSAGTDNEKPESYWVRRREDVIGRFGIEELRRSRQTDTYQAIVRAVTGRSVSIVADVGCNISALGLLLIDQGYTGTYVGIDNNPYALAEARKALANVVSRYDVIQANIRALPFPDRFFDCVVMKDVLEHTEDFRPFLGEAARVASRHLIIGTFILWTEGPTIIRREPEGFYHNMYNRDEVLDFASALGFGVEQVISALEQDARPNEVIVFARTG